jgi:hypothetical protein
MRAIWKVISSKLLTKQAMGKKIILYKSMYTLKLLLKIAITGIEALVSGNKLLYACVKEIWHL